MAGQEVYEGLYKANLRFDRLGGLHV